MWGWGGDPLVSYHRSVSRNLNLKQSRCARGSSWGGGERKALGSQHGAGGGGHSSRSCTYKLRRTRQNVECVWACEAQLISSSLQVCLLEICHEMCLCVREWMNEGMNEWVSVISVLSMLVRLLPGKQKEAFNSVGNNSYNHVYLRLEWL